MLFAEHIVKRDLTRGEDFIDFSRKYLCGFIVFDFLVNMRFVNNLNCLTACICMSRAEIESAFHAKDEVDGDGDVEVEDSHISTFNQVK